jgi:hypothetical protein
MKVFLKYCLWVVLALIIIVIGIFAYLLTNKDAIKNYALDEINKQLTVELQVKEADVTLFKQFPKVSLDLQHVSITDPIQPKQYLIQASHVFIGFNLFDIIRKNYNIKLITIDEADVNLYTSKKGVSNYHIFKPTDKKEASNESFLLNLKEVQLNNVSVDYIDHQYQQQHVVVFEAASLYGDFTEKGETIGIKGKMFANKLRSGKITYVKDKPLKLNVVFKTNHQTKTYTFERGNIDVDKLQLSLTGKIINKAKAVGFDLEVGARNLDIPSLLSLYPAANLPEDLKSDGEIYLEGSIKGEANDKTSPAIHFTFGVSKGSLKKGEGLALKNINFKGEFSNGAKRNQATSFVKITDLSFLLKDALVAGGFEVANFTDPLLNASLKGNIDAKNLLEFWQNDIVKSADGSIDFDVLFKGKISNLSQQKWLENNSAGRLNLSLANISFKQNNKVIKRVIADLKIDNKNVVINQFEADVDESDVKISGTIGNFIPYLLSSNQALQAHIKYQSNVIDINNFMMPLSPTNMDNNKRGFALPENISITADVKAGKVLYHTFNAKQVSAKVNWKGKKITVDNFDAQTMDGRLQFDGEVENAPDGRFMITASSQLNNIDINTLFKSCNEFGQQEITSKHIQGKLSGTIDLVSVWNNNLDCDLNKLYALCNIEIKNGELNGYKPLEALGKYIDVNDLRALKFADLKNTIEIKNKTIFIPGFDVKNNALNLTLSGSHTFDNFIDYKIKMRLNELLAKKRKPTKNEFNEEQTADGGVNIYLTMKGPIDNFKITYDKKEVKEQLKQDLKKEKENIIDVLKKEFVGESNTEEGKKNKIKEKKADDDELEFEPE